MLHVDSVTLAFGECPVLRGVDARVGEGETLAVLGPSGSGKTTLLRVIAGLERPDDGRVLLDGRDLAGVPPHRRGIGLMFQDNALFPHRDVAGNVGFGLRMHGAPSAEVARRVSELLELVGLPGTEGRDPATLSGGEQQRIALARALAPSPRVLLLDEPLGALDAPLRARLAADLAELFASLEQAVVYVTHDVGEAFAVGRRVAVFRDGRIIQAAAPDELWSAPADGWVARFLGMRNVTLLDDGRYEIVRPEAVTVRPAADGAGDGTVASVRRQGPLVRILVRLDGGREVEAAAVGAVELREGGRAAVSIDPAGRLLVPADTPTG